MFGSEPAEVRADYAEFELDDPPLVLSLEPTPRGSAGPLSRPGFHLSVRDDKEVLCLSLQ